MQGKKVYQEKLFINFQLSEHVPEDNLYRRILRMVDFQHLYGLTSKYYGREGQQSIDPVVFIKLMLVGYLENINSDRRIIETSKLRMDILFFIGYDIGEPLPWHSTLSRTRQLYDQEVFTSIFQGILCQCMDKGMLCGKRQAVDGFFIKANASLDKMVRNEVLEDAARFAQELEDNQDVPTTRSVELPRKTGRHGGKGYRKKNPSNCTHSNPYDPQAKISVKPGKATALNYLGEVGVDTSSHLITYIEAFCADTNDSQCLPAMLQGMVGNLALGGLQLKEVLADTGFSNGKSLRALEEMGITGYIPTNPHVVLYRTGLRYHPEDDTYTCSAGKKLKVKAVRAYQGQYKKEYGISHRDCSTCRLAAECVAYTASRAAKKEGGCITDTVDKPYYNRMDQRMKTPRGKRMMKIRQSTVEPVISHLVQHYAIRRVATIGLLQANKCVTMAAAAYNLKKLLKYIGKPIKEALSAKATVKLSLGGALARHKSIFGRQQVYRPFLL